MLNRTFTYVLDDRTSFRAKGWPFRGASSALPADLREKRKKKGREAVTEGKSERGERERDGGREGEREDVKT